MPPSLGQLLHLEVIILVQRVQHGVRHVGDGFEIDPAGQQVSRGFLHDRVLPETRQPREQSDNSDGNDDEHDDRGDHDDDTFHAPGEDAKLRVGDLGGEENLHRLAFFAHKF